MLGIKFAGRYSRGKFWLMSFVMLVISGLSFIPFIPAFQKVQHAVVQKALIKEIMVSNQGKISHDNVVEFKSKIENANNLDEKTKQTLIEDVNKIEVMSEQELLEAASDSFPMKDFSVLVLFLIIQFYIGLVNFSIFVRRGHDLNLSGWVTLIALFIPFVNLIISIYYGFFKGSEGENKYGSARAAPQLPRHKTRL